MALNDQEKKLLRNYIMKDLPLHLKIALNQTLEETALLSDDDVKKLLSPFQKQEQDNLSKQIQTLNDQVLAVITAKNDLDSIKLPEIPVATDVVDVTDVQPVKDIKP